MFLFFLESAKSEQEGLADPQAVRVGFERAFVTILDSNITTLLVAIILAGIGSGPVKGFAITLGDWYLHIAFYSNSCHTSLD